MTKSSNQPDTATNSPDQGADTQPNAGQNAGPNAAPDPSATPPQSGPENAVSLEARREALRNAERGDQFVVATDLEDSEQREAAPGVREQD